jgi:hypothetical protein
VIACIKASACELGVNSSDLHQVFLVSQSWPEMAYGPKSRWDLMGSIDIEICAMLCLLHM